MKASSLTANTSFAWTTKKATIIVKIIGIMAKRYKKPTINAIEHTSSPKIANPRDRGLPIPSGSGNTVDNSWKLLHFWRKISRAKAGNSSISFTHRIPKKASSLGPTIARTIRTHIKNMATLLNARRSPTVRLLSGIGSSMSFCQRTEPQKTMTEKTKRTGRLLCQPVYFLMVPKGRLEVFSTIRSYNTLQYNTLTK